MIGIISSLLQVKMITDLQNGKFDTPRNHSAGKVLLPYRIAWLFYGSGALLVQTFSVATH